MALTNLPLEELLRRFSAPDPTPGGGSASALASAVGASLLLMVAALPKTRHGTDEDRAVLVKAAAAIDGIRNSLTAAVDADTAAYDRVVAAYKLPKASPDEASARKAAIQHAMQGATDVPLGVMRQTIRAMEEAALVAAHGHKAASSDVGVALALLAAGAAGAKLNVDVNLEAIVDNVYRDRVSVDARGLLERSGALADRARALLREGE